MIRKITLIFCLVFFSMTLMACANRKIDSKAVRQPDVKAAVQTGIDRIDEYIELFKDKKVGLITNATGINSEYIDTGLILAQKTNLKAIFSPEHGYLGQVTAGKDVGTYYDNRLGVEVYSLYGATKKPTAAMLKDIDVLVFDIQDIGVRNYTYIYTMAYAMQAAAENGKKFIVLDRPNPLGGKMEGPVLKKGFESFVGLYPIPYRHGLTVGEAARLFNKEFGINADLTVIPLKGWTRDMYFEDTNLPWVMTSPNIPTLDSVMGYAMTGFYTGIKASNGVGTTRPFEFVGAEWMSSDWLVGVLENADMPGVKFRPTAFLPMFGAFSGKTCYGVQIHFVDKKKINAVETGAFIYYIVRQMAKVEKVNPNQNPRIDKNLGENSLWDGEPIEEVFKRWKNECESFAKLAEPYLLYK